MTTDQGIAYVLLEHFVLHLHPRALALEKQLDAGGRLADTDIAHVEQVLEDLRALRTFIDRHPEHADIAGGVIQLYAGIARRALHNETARLEGKAAA